MERLDSATAKSTPGRPIGHRVAQATTRRIACGDARRVLEVGHGAELGVKVVHALGLCELLPRLLAPRIAADVPSVNVPMCVAHIRPSMRASLLVTSAVGISRSGGAPGTPSAWETPPAAPARSRLVLNGGFTVVDRQQRRLHQRAHTLGFPDLHSYLKRRSQDDASLAQLADELHTTVDIVRRLVTNAGVHRSPRPVRSALQRCRTTDQQLAARAAALGFPTLRAYLADRTHTRRWPASQLARELGVHPTTIRRRLTHYGLHRQQPTRRPTAATSRQLATWAAKRKARLAALGFAAIDGYLRVRRVGQGWSLRHMTAELQVGSAWLKGHMRRHGIP